jgi:hypothetical protein
VWLTFKGVRDRDQGGTGGGRGGGGAGAADGRRLSASNGLRPAGMGGAKKKGSGH